jgi:ribosomal protein S19E (S16A)
VNVKDVPSKEFIDAFAKHLKKGNKIKIPEVRLHFHGLKRPTPPLSYAFFILLSM